MIFAPYVGQRVMVHYVSNYNETAKPRLQDKTGTVVHVGNTNKLNNVLVRIDNHGEQVNVSKGNLVEVLV